jgi:hypothetical protein
MAEPLLGREPVVGQWDPGGGLATVRGWSAGPAGSAGLDLGAGIELDVDVAEPERLVDLAIELPRAARPGALTVRQRRTLDVLLGPERVDTFVAAARQTSGSEPTPPWRLDDRGVVYRSPPGAEPPGEDEGYRRRSRPGGVGPTLHRTALAHAVAGAPAVPMLVRAVGLLEAAVALSPVSQALDLSAAVRRDSRVGTELLLDVLAGDGLVVPDDRAALELAALLRRVRHHLDGQDLAAARLVALARQLDQGDHVAGPRRPPRAAGARPTAFRAPHREGIHEGAPRDREAEDTADADLAAAAMPAAMAAERVAAVSAAPSFDRTRRLTFDRHSLAGALDEARVSLVPRMPSDVEVRVAGWADRGADLWVRAFRAADDCLIAVVPFRRDGDDAVARLLVPPDPADRLEIDITDRPEMPRPSATLAAAQRAIHAGRAAARAERLGRPREAADWWVRCAEQWDAAGDAARAGQARGHAADGRSRSRGRGPGTIPPLVTDLVGGSP